MLALREVMNPAYGLFHEDEESHLIWFSDSLVGGEGRGGRCWHLSEFAHS